MKKIITTVMALTLALGMSVTAIAAPSPVKDPNATGTMAGEATEEELAAANAALAEEGISYLPADEATKTSAKDAADKLEVPAGQEATVIDVKDVVVPKVVSDLLDADKGVYIDISWTLNWDADTMVVLHYNTKTGTWEKVESWLTGRVLTARFTSLSPVAFVEIAKKEATNTPDNNKPSDSEVTPANPSYNGWAGVDMAALWAAQAKTQAGTTSPKTGEAGVVGFALIAVACGAALVFTKKKFA